MAKWQWQSGNGKVAVAVEKWQWQSGSGKVAMTKWQWQSVQWYTLDHFWSRLDQFWSNLDNLRFEVGPDLVQVGPVLVQPDMPFFRKSSILTLGINIFEKFFQDILGKHILEFWAHNPIFKSQKNCFEVGPDLVHSRVSSTV